ncbi:hypothetical protein RF11_07159 [Thelohanellus kitauei]|uniref:Uncharacterized protein n=1 Tax=Thelohanellus kitauei TaxID=669202 RepID=A0A0C2ML42_THEKT|nr:hypothetical protein RF11_07159 [Thelohanellus kitauei]
MKQFDFEASTLIIRFEQVLGTDVSSFLYFNCNLFDTAEYIKISKCQISAKTSLHGQVENHLFKDELKITKKTKYEIENLEKTFYQDLRRSKFLTFLIKNMTIEPLNYTRICTLKQTKMDTNENGLACVSLLPQVYSIKTIMFWLTFIVLIVLVTMILKMYIS